MDRIGETTLADRQWGKYGGSWMGQYWGSPRWGEHWGRQDRGDGTRYSQGQGDGARVTGLGIARDRVRGLGRPIARDWVSV